MSERSTEPENNQNICSVPELLPDLSSPEHTHTDFNSTSTRITLDGFTVRYCVQDTETSGSVLITAVFLFFPLWAHGVVNLSVHIFHCNWITLISAAVQFRRGKISSQTTWSCLKDSQSSPELYNWTPVDMQPDVDGQDTFNEHRLEGSPRRILWGGNMWGTSAYSFRCITSPCSPSATPSVSPWRRHHPLK